MEVVETCEKRTLSSTKRSFTSIDEEVVGFEKDAESIMKKLTGGPKELDIISIVGMPGLGKTTLARKVYNNPSVVNHFDVKVWCPVSKTFDVRTLLVEMLNQITRGKSKINEGNDIAADKLRKSLIGRRYLIVLNDIWEVDAWEDLGLCFPNVEDGSRIMITTRIEQVAKHLQHCSDPYPLRFLTLEESWELLQKKVFGGESCPSDLLEAGLQVAKHCKGLPLVIVLVAGIIGEKEKEELLTWLEVSNNLSTSHVIGEQSMKVMQSSYDHLENHLKPCLLYMGLFPEDYRIPVSDLLKLWMAEEFVLNVDTENMEEAARLCLNDLLNRSLVMVSKRKINGDIEYCVLHDVVREFCTRKLGEEMFKQQTVPYNPYDQHLYSKESRSCIYIHDDLINPMFKSKETNCFDRCLKPLNQRALFFKKKKEENCHRPLEFIAHPTFSMGNQSNPLPLLVKLRLVRVLHLLDVKLPHSWGATVKSLTHLRYLAISVKKFNFKRVSHLHDLQTLKVVSEKYSRTSPAAMWKMTKLRHVGVNKFSFRSEDNDRAVFEESSETMLEKLKTFETYNIRANDVNPRFWWRCPNLEELSLRIQDVPTFPLFPLPEIHSRLLSLDLVVNHWDFWNSVGWESYFIFPSNIRHMSISGCFLTEEIVLTLSIARLKKLESVRLAGGFPLVASGYSWDIRNVEFPALKYLTIEGARMEEWNASEASFPMLEKLVLTNCFYFNEIPSCFADIPTLRLIQLYDCAHSIGVSAMNIKKEVEENTGCDSLQVLLL